MVVILEHHVRRIHSIGHQGLALFSDAWMTGNEDHEHSNDNYNIHVARGLDMR
jgi:hypothetical protein